MIEVSDAFKDAITASAPLAVEADVLVPGEAAPVVISDGLTEGTVNIDANAETLRRCDLTFVDDGTLGLVPTDAASLLAPYGNEIRPKRGVVFPDGTRELVTLGVFRIDDVQVSDGRDGQTISLTGMDRSARVIPALFEEKYTIAVGTDYLTAIQDLIPGVYPDVTFDFDERTLTTPTLIAEESENRWQFAQTMASAIGMELFFNNEGVLRLRAIPDVTAGAPQTYLQEGEGGVLLSADQGWTRQDAFNRWIYTGDNPDGEVPPRGVATDDDPNSPTYYFGPYGRAPVFRSSAFISTDEQAADAANGAKAKELGTTRSIDFGALVDPSLEQGDVARVTRERSEIDEDHVIDSLVQPLGPEGTMSGHTRSVRVT